MISSLNRREFEKLNNELNEKHSKKHNIHIFRINDSQIILLNYKYLYETIKKLVKYFIIFLTFLVIYFLYFKSLEICLDGIAKCSHKYSWIERKIEEEIISCILMEIMLQLMILRILSKKNLIHIIIILITFFKYSHGQNFYDHGYYNFFFYIFLLSIMTIAFLPIDIFIIIFKRIKKSVKLIIIYFLLILFAFIFLSTSKKVCDDWPKGLNNTSIENDKSKYGCQIQIPKLCLYKSFEYFQDYTMLTRKKCKNNKNGKEQKKKLLKLSKSPYINKNVKRIGYPLLNKIPRCLLDFPEYKNELQKCFLNNLIDMDNKEILNKYFKDKIPEVEIDFTTIEKPKLLINLHFNNSLSNERKILEKNSEPFSKNILILYLDSLSRVNALRQLKKTTNFFENFISYKGNFNEKYPSENFHSFQFFKYHSFYGFTTHNYPFLFYGKNPKNRKKIFITKFLKKNGFVTSEAIDWCGIDNIRTFHSFTKEDIFDHFLNLCDPNNDHFNLNTIRCLYDKQNTEYLIEYTNQFWNKYIDNRKYSIIISNSAHEGTLTVIKYLDTMISNFLNNLFKNNLLKDTIVFLLSDHGSGMPSIYSMAEFYRIEVSLPILLILVNDRKNTTYENQYKYIHENQQNFITSFDIYNTLGNIIYGNKFKSIKSNSKNQNTCKSPYGISLFNKINSKTRNPKKYQHLTLRGVLKYSCK